ncbi:Mannosyltransferase (PIG-V) [Agreia bicolorata]|uniref:Mannosyltransferase (PIG-V) n=2 Tax=Agreia bicolorata TaxID=110935 RepID=A0A1T4YDE4_9MICO|nr:mannosyltransferase family protein [Agreia bicolorata]KJC65645.1 membrane protein [Agreia bicolorata]SKA99341.1 Mannosyltransferase (PIG-V) [Agreia bicolorata]
MITRRRAALVRYRVLPWWARVALIYGAARLVSTVIILAIAARQGPNPWTGAHPSYLDFATIWDGRWYFIVAMTGYPDQLPLTVDGHIGENAWAFMPVYPFLVRGLMVVTTLSWPAVSVAVSVIAGLGAALVFFKLMSRVLGDSQTAMFSVVLFSVAPVSALFQLSYAESLYTFLLVVGLYLVVLRRYGWLVPLIAVMALTRPSGLAFALFLGLHVIVRLVARRTDPFPWPERIAVSLIAVFSAAMGLLWPAIAGLVTGDLTAYTDTELAWRSAYIGYQHLVPFAPWFQGANWWMNSQSGFPTGGLVVVLLIAAFGLSLFIRPVRRLGVDLRLWVLSYGVYLLAVFFPQSSTFRLLMPMFPLLGAVAQPKSMVYRVSMVLVFVAAQTGWLLICWGVDGADWTPP